MQPCTNKFKATNSNSLFLLIVSILRSDYWSGLNCSWAGFRALGWVLLKIAEKIIKRQMFPKLHVLSLHVIVASKSVSHLKHVSNCQICRKMLLKEKIKLNAYSQGAQVSSHLSIMYCTFIIWMFYGMACLCHMSHISYWGTSSALTSLTSSGRSLSRLWSWGRCWCRQ